LTPRGSEIRFLSDGDSTRVELEHRGRDALGDGGAARRDNYDTGWEFVLGRFVAGTDWPRS
jgi:hypothetical protein